MATLRVGGGRAGAPAGGSTFGKAYCLNSASAPLRCFCLAAISARARAISASSAAIYSSQLGDPQQGQILRLLRLVARNQVLFLDDCHVRPSTASLGGSVSLYRQQSIVIALHIGTFSMAAPLMPKATAVWLVENTSLTFEQIAEFCGLHPLEVQAIADGEVATQMQGLDPVANGQTTTEEIERCQARSRGAAETVAAGDPAAARQAQGAALHADREAPGQAGRDHVPAAQPPGTVRRADLEADRHDQADDRGGARPHPLEQRQHQAAPPGRARPVHACRNSTTLSRGRCAASARPATRRSAASRPATRRASRSRR